jgi:hypothetical protein
MAGNQNSGGLRPTAAQNNPANVSATGGAGQSGTQPARYMSGLPYGQGQAQMQQQTAAPMAGSSTPTTTSSQRPTPPSIKTLTEPSETLNRPITHGMPFGPGAGPEVINTPAQIPQDRNPSVDIIKALYQQDPRNEDLRYIIESLPQASA